MKFELKCTHSNGDINTAEFSEVVLSEVLQNIMLFLRGCGFILDTIDYDYDKLPSS